MIKVLYISGIISIFYTTIAAPQTPELTEQLKISDPITAAPGDNETEKKIQDNIVVRKVKSYEIAKVNMPIDEGIYDKVYKITVEPFLRIIRAPKVNSVLRNIGTCAVNGAMELVSFYLPPSFMPLIATLAGLAIPFEPVVMLKEKMPVTSYRRAFKTAMNTFLSTFDQYKIEDDEYDPYMTRRFNRRFMDDTSNTRRKGSGKSKR